MTVNFRAGPILQLNWEEFDIICRTNRELMTNDHKTGKFYTVHLMIQPDQREFLRLMRQKYEEEFHQPSKFVFASQKNKVESSICRFIQDVFNETFGDDPAVVRFNANSIRKFWERMWTVIKRNVSEGVTKAHLAQTAHSEKTANERYMAKNGTREERNQVLNIYLDRLENAKDDEVGIEEDECAAPEDEAVDSDFEDTENDRSLLIRESTCATPQIIPTNTRFNLARDSLTTSTPLIISNSQQQPTPPPRLTSTATNQQQPTPPVTSTSSVTNQKQPTHPVTSTSTVTNMKQPTHPVTSKPSIPPVPRDSLNSTLEEEVRPPTAVEKYMKSLRHFRIKPNAAPWTEDEKKACLLFSQCRGTVSEPEVKKRIEEGGFNLTTVQCHRIYQKIKTATGVFRK